jgi:hypothetical protein
VKKLIEFASISVPFLAGYTRWRCDDKMVDYSEYLGPDWEPKFTGAASIIPNHVTFFDPAFITFQYFPCLTSRDGFRTMPLVGSILKSLSTIYVVGTGKDKDGAKAKRQAAMDLVKEH